MLGGRQLLLALLVLAARGAAGAEPEAAPRRESHQSGEKDTGEQQQPAERPHGRVRAHPRWLISSSPSLSSSSSSRNDGSHAVCESACCRAVQARFACNVSGCEDLVAGYVNYLDVYYCALPGPVSGGGSLTAARGALAAALLAWLLLLLHLIETTVADYFCAALTLTVDALQLSPNIAGVAFLAVGNAAPGVIASIAAFASNSPKVGIGTTLGAGIFDSCAVVGVITLVGDVRLPRRSFVRDLLFFLLAVVYLFAVAYDGLITLGEAAGFIAIYGVFIVVVAGSRTVRIMLGGEDAETAAERASHELLRAGSGAASTGADGGGSPASYQSASELDMRSAIESARAAALRRGDGGRDDDDPEGSDEEQQIAARRALFTRGSTASRLALQRSRSVGAIVPLTAAMLQPLETLPPLPALLAAPSPAAAAAAAAPVKASRWTRQYLAVAGGERKPFRWTSYHKTQLAVQLGERLRARGARHVETASGRQVDFLELLARNPGAAGNLAASLANALGASGAAAPAPPAALAAPAAPTAAPTPPPPPPPSGCAAVAFARVRAGAGAVLSAWMALMHTAELPVSLLRKLTVPVMHDGSYRRRLLCLTLPGGFAFAAFMLSHIVEALPTSVRGVPNVASAAVLGAVVGALLYFVPGALPRKAARGGGGAGISDDPATASLLRSAPIPADADAVELVTGGGKGGGGRAAGAVASPPPPQPASKRPWYKRLLWPFAVALAGPADEPRPTGVIFGVLLTASFLLSLFWMILITDEIVGVAIFMGKVLGIPDVIMGLTVLAVGSSVGDLAASLTIARDGYATMAVAGAYAGPMLNVLAGIGLPMLLFTAEAANGAYNIGRPTLLTLVSYAALVIPLLITLVWVIADGWRLTARLGKLLIAWFAVFVVLVAALAAVLGDKG